MVTHTHTHFSRLHLGSTFGFGPGISFKTSPSSRTRTRTRPGVKLLTTSEITLFLTWNRTNRHMLTWTFRINYATCVFVKWVVYSDEGIYDREGDLRSVQQHWWILHTQSMPHWHKVHITKQARKRHTHTPVIRFSCWTKHLSFKNNFNSDK